MVQQADLTALLLAWRPGETPSSELVDRVYSELRRLARGYLRGERRDHSLPPTALVHEAYLRLLNQRRVQWQNRAHFFAMAAHLMRRILVDHARAHRARKRGGGIKATFLERDRASEPLDLDILSLDVALKKFGETYPRQCQLVELRFFAGLTVTETATVLGIAPITVKRDWALARAWLWRELRGGTP